MVETKKCRDCGETKPLADFFRNKGGKNGVRSYCKPCDRRRATAWKKKNPGKVATYNRRSEVKKHYGLTIPQYWGYFWTVGYKCLCGREAVHLDHCHETGKNRRVLCRGCNHALGNVMDDPQRLRDLADYLEEHAA